MQQLKIYLPPPLNHQDFQALVKDIATCTYNSDTVIEYGRLGQTQHGIDVYAEDFGGKKIGIQCKESKDPLTEREVEKDAVKAHSFRPSLDLFVVATSAPTDAKLQGAVIAMNSKKTHPFALRVTFWNDIINDLNRYALVLNACYQSYKQTFQQSDESNHLECLRTAFDRPAFKDDFLHERNYDDFEEALVTTKRLFRTGFTKDRWSQIPVVQTVPAEFLPDGPYRTFVASLESKLETTYQTYMRDRKKILADARYGKDRAGHYNILRTKVLELLNARLSAAGLSEIDYAYKK